MDEESFTTAPELEEEKKAAEEQVEEVKEAKAEQVGKRRGKARRKTSKVQKKGKKGAEVITKARRRSLSAKRRVREAPEVLEAMFSNEEKPEVECQNADDPEKGGNKSDKQPETNTDSSSECPPREYASLGTTNLSSAGLSPANNSISGYFTRPAPLIPHPPAQPKIISHKDTQVDQVDPTGPPRSKNEAPAGPSGNLPNGGDITGTATDQDPTQAPPLPAASPLPATGPKPQKSEPKQPDTKISPFKVPMPVAGTLREKSGSAEPKAPKTTPPTSPERPKNKVSWAGMHTALNSGIIKTQKIARKSKVFHVFRLFWPIFEGC